VHSVKASTDVRQALTSKLSPLLALTILERL
jgi:hypothetical protein